MHRPQITMCKPCIPFLLLLISTILSPSPTTAEINSLTVNSTINSDTRPMILIAKFCSTFKARVNISVSSVSVISSSSSQPEASHIGFFIANDETLLKVQQNPSICALDSPYIYPLFTFRDLSPPSASFNRSYPVLSPNEYGIFFANCASGTSVSMVVRAEMFNLIAENECSVLMERKRKQMKSLSEMEDLLFVKNLRRI